MSQIPSLPLSLPPVFPLELEREIFETAARLDRSTCPTLILVAQRVQTWVTPLLYKVVIRHFDVPGVKFPSTPLERLRPPPSRCTIIRFLQLRTKKGKFSTSTPGQGQEPQQEQTQRGYGLGAHVHHLLLDMSLSEASVTQYISSCPNLTSVALWNTNAKGPSTLPFLDALPNLTRLSAYLDTLTGILTLNNPARLRPCFSRLTHLEIANPCRQWDDWRGLADVGREVGGLTHLAVANGTSEEVIRGVFEFCRALRVLVIVMGLKHSLNEAEIFPKKKGEDLRVVRCYLGAYVKDWLLGALGGRAFWDVAGEEVERQLALRAEAGEN